MSSSAHLTALPWLLGWPAPAHRTTPAAALHAGSCVGVGLALLGPGADRPPVRLVALAAATCLPAAVAGLLAADAVEERLGRPRQLAALLAAAGAALAVADRRPEDGQLGPREAAAAALAQVAALAPGVSRSGAALTALRALRVPRGPAQEFSLLMSLPVTAGAAALTLARADRTQLEPDLALGAVAAAGAGLLAARLLVRRGGHALVIYGLYRLGFAVIIARALRHRPWPPEEELR